MKKSTIWLLVLVMVLAFSGLLYMQVGYVNVVYRSRNERFNESVRKALYEVNKELEREEVRRLVEEKYNLPASSYSPKGFSSYEDREEEEFQLDQLPQNPYANSSSSKDRFLHISRLIQSQLSTKVGYFRDMIVEFAIDMLRRGTQIPFEDRVSRKQLEDSLDEALASGGILLPYVYEVIGRNNKVYLSSGAIPSDEAYSVYTQTLFLNDAPSELHFLRVYFPGKRQYISGTIDFLIPSVIFTSLLFVVFIYTIVIIFKQKKLAELRTDFINNMTHELKTPVSTIMLGTQMLQDDDVNKTPEVFKQILRSVSDESRRLNFLVEKVLQMSLFDREKVAFKLKELELQDLIISVVNTFSLKVESFGGSLEIVLDAEETNVLADEMHLTNVLFNLLDNAVKYRRHDVPLQIEVGTYNENRRLCIYIQDNGQGIKKEYLKKIFERFFRVPTGNVHDVKGFGLGLAYVYKIIGDHEGTIRAESEWGEGTRFVISLPIASEQEALRLS